MIIIHLSGEIEGKKKTIFDFSVSPKNVMMIGIAAQIIFGTLLGLIHNNEWHIILRWLTAASCALMYTSGSMICKITFGDIFRPLKG